MTANGYFTFSIAFILSAIASVRVAGIPFDQTVIFLSQHAGVQTTPDSTGHRELVLGGITRMDSTRKVIYLVFTGHEFADGGEIIRTTLKNRGAKASFFFTGDFYRNPRYSQTIRRLQKDGHYLGGHSDKHLLYAPWDKRDSLLVTKEEFLADLRANYRTMSRFGITKSAARYFIPPYEWYNQTITDWCRGEGLILINYTPGTTSNADYTTPDMGKHYASSDSIYARILRYESAHASGLNGFILLMHIGTDPRRTDKFYRKLDALTGELNARGYQFNALSSVPTP